MYHARTEHIDTRFYRITKLVSFSKLLLEKVHTFENAVDMLTNHIMIDKFKHFLNLINIFFQMLDGRCPNLLFPYPFLLSDGYLPI